MTSFDRSFVMKRVTRYLSLVVLASIVVSFSTFAQDPPPAGGQEPAPAAPAANGGQRGGAARGPRSYEQVITKEAKTDKGVFDVHKVGETYYYEIPKALLGKEFLLVTQIQKNTVGAGYGGSAVGNRVVKWERQGNRVFLRSLDYEIVADKSSPVAKAVAEANNDAIIMAFNVEANGPEESSVIDVTRLFTTDVPEFSARARLRGRGMDTGRSFIEKIVSYPENIEAQASHTYTLPTDQGGAGQRGQAGGMRPGSATVVMHWSMVKLPEKPMMPRLFDERVGYFTTSTIDYSRDEHRAQRRTFIARYRLEKKDPSAAISEPIKPIVYYIDPATPKQWVPYLKAGIESWQVAFEQAGFKNAILAKEAPAPEEDPDWSAEDARYSVVRWLPSTTENASGPHISDPRTGEIIEADIQFYHNVMNLVRDWYFVQVGPLDPRARTLPLPDALMGRLLQYVVAHEIGHTLGLQHNMKASSLYPADKLRDPEFIRKMGHTPTLMDYSRFNYVAQPEDHIPPDDLIPVIGPYDKFAIMWGYKPIPDAKTSDAEKPTLDQWARVQDTQPWLRFSTDGHNGSDPGDQREAVGDADAVASSTLGMKNLKRVGDMLLAATSTQKGEPYDDLAEVYGRLLGQWVLEMNHVASIIGGFDSQQKHIGQEGVRFTPVPRQRQVAAVRFLQENAFKTPSFAVNPDILRRMEASGVLDRIKTSQNRVLATLFENTRVARLIEQEAIDGSVAYRPTDFFGDVRRGIWSELNAPQVKIDAYRRNLQRSYLDLFNDKLNGRNPVANDMRAFIRGELVTLRGAITAALGKGSDRATQLHLRDAQDQIARILDPKFDRVSPGPAAPLAIANGADDDAENCFPDYAIR
jgi:hypothetical protein